MFDVEYRLSKNCAPNFQNTNIFNYSWEVPKTKT